MNIMLILIYLLSVFILYEILKTDVILLGYKPTLKNLYDYYKFDIIWTIFPIINTFIVLIWVIAKITKKI